MENTSHDNIIESRYYRRAALKIAITYVLISALWILFSDKLLLTNPETVVYISTFKGWVYTVVVGVFLYFVIAKVLNRSAHEKAKRKSAERELENSEEKLKIALEASNLAVWDWNIARDTWSVSPQYFTLLGYTPEDGPMNRAVWLSRAHPDDREIIQAKINTVLNGQDDHYDYEVRMLHADGTYRWHRVFGHVAERDEKGKAARMIGVRMDITELKNEGILLKNKLEDVEKINSAMVGRELKMEELKQEIEELKKKLSNK